MSINGVEVKVNGNTTVKLYEEPELKDEIVPVPVCIFTFDKFECKKLNPLAYRFPIVAIEDDKLVEFILPPVTSKVYAGLIVPIPTFVALINKLLDVGEVY